jgi:molecular chaperone DnaK (HSP70)
MHGDTTLGGVDFVRRLLDFCVYEHKVKKGEDISENVVALERLRV